MCRILVGTLHYVTHKTATHFSGAKVGHCFMKIQHPWHHSVDKKHFFLHVKFGVRFTISSTIKSKPNEKCHFPGEIVHALFFKKRRLKNSPFFGFLNWRAPAAHDACADRAQNAK
jgi:hypothetical protein